MGVVIKKLLGKHKSKCVQLLYATTQLIFDVEMQCPVVSMNLKSSVDNVVLLSNSERQFILSARKRPNRIGHKDFPQEKRFKSKCVLLVSVGEKTSIGVCMG